MSKAIEAFRTIAEVADDLGVPKHVLRFWEVKFPQVRPMKRGGGRRFYRPEDLELLRGIQALLHAEAYTIKGVQRILREQGVDHVKKFGRDPQLIQSTRGGKRRRGDGAVRPTTAAALSGALSAAPGAGAPPPPTKASPRKGSARALDGAKSQQGADTSRERIKSVIAELEACRALLGGQPAREGGAAAGGRTRASR